MPLITFSANAGGHNRLKERKGKLLEAAAQGGGSTLVVKEGGGFGGCYLLLLYKGQRRGGAGAPRKRGSDGLARFSLGEPR
jgi:hypothetical protein